MNRNLPRARCSDCKCCALYVKDGEGKRITKDEFLWKNPSHSSLCCCYKWWFFVTSMSHFPFAWFFSEKTFFFPLHYINNGEIRLNLTGRCHYAGSLKAGEAQSSSLYYFLACWTFCAWCLVCWAYLLLPFIFLDVVDSNLFVMRDHCNVITLLLLLWSAFRATQYNCLNVAYLHSTIIIYPLHYNKPLISA